MCERFLPGIDNLGNIFLPQKVRWACVDSGVLGRCGCITRHYMFPGRFARSSPSYTPTLPLRVLPIQHRKRPFLAFC